MLDSPAAIISQQIKVDVKSELVQILGCFVSPMCCDRINSIMT